MWGFLKCNYSYTKILIVLLFSLSHLFFFFFKAGWFPHVGLPRQLHGPKKEFLGGCKGSEQQLVAQGHAPSPSPAPPHSLPPRQQCSAKGQGSVWSPCGEPWTQAQRLWHWDWGRFWSGKPGASLFQRDGEVVWAACPLSFRLLLSPPWAATRLVFKTCDFFFFT